MELLLGILGPLDYFEFEISPRHKAQRRSEVRTSSAPDVSNQTHQATVKQAFRRRHFKI